MEQNYDKTPTPYEIFQMETYGDTLPDSQEEESEFDRLSTAELNYIFNNENIAS